jgi:hypothetical protein
MFTLPEVMTDTLLTVVSDEGTPWLVRIVREGDRYGRNDCLTHDGMLPLVEFYDLRHMHTDRGQFVSRYFVDTLQGHPVGRGLSLDGGVPSWTIDGGTFSRVMTWVGEVG